MMFSPTDDDRRRKLPPTIATEENDPMDDNVIELTGRVAQGRGRPAITDVQESEMDNTRLTTPANHRGMRLTTWHQREKLREFLKSRVGWQKDPWIQKWLAELDCTGKEIEHWRTSPLPERRCWK